MNIGKIGSPTNMPASSSPVDPSNVENSSGPSIVGTPADALTQQRGLQELERPSRSDRASRKYENDFSGQLLQASLDKQLTENRADAIHKACEGLGTDEQAIYHNLSGLNEKQRSELNEVYKQKYGISLEDQLRGELSGSELDKVLTSTNKEPTTKDPVLLTDQKDGLVDIRQEQQLKMQVVMERMTKAEQMASNISKKLNNTIKTIVSNVK